MQTKFIKLETPSHADCVGSGGRNYISTLGNNPSQASLSTQPFQHQRPQTGVVTHSSKPDETLKMFRVRPKLINYPAHFKISSETESQPIKTLEQNLFSDNGELLSQLSSQDKGPKFDAKGNVVKHSIVGGVTSFLREYQNKMQRNSKSHLKQIRIHQEDQELPHDNLNTQGSSVVRSSQNTFLDLDSKKKKLLKAPYKETLLNQQEVASKIESCKQQVLQANKMVSYQCLNYLNKQEETRLATISTQLSKGDKLLMSSFERVGQKFLSIVDKWDDDEKQFASQVGRKPQNSIYRKSEQARTKNEVKELLETITPDYEKTGTMVWQKGLRTPQSSIGQRNPYQFIDSLEQGKFADSRCNVIEIIRKPQSSKLRSKYEGVLPYSSFTSNKYFQSKLQSHKSEVEKLILCNQDQIGELEIYGTSVLKNELQILAVPLKKNGENQEKKYVKRTLKDEEDPILHIHDTQTVQEAWNKNYLLKTGKYELVKSFYQS